jgi:hypothetical protein
LSPRSDAPASAFSDVAFDVSASTPQRSNAPRLTILQRFVKLVAQTQEPVVAPPREPRLPENFGENVAFVVSPPATPEPTTQPLDAAFPFVVDAFEPAPQDCFSYF